MKTNTPSLQKLPDKTFTLKLEIKKDDIEKERQNILKLMQQDFETKGFRKGKAPLNVVEQNVAPEKLFEEVASHLISHAYADEIKKNDLKPIIQPQVKFEEENPDLSNDWHILLTSCELPQINLDPKYLEEAKKVFKDDQISDENKKIDKVFETIVKNTKLELPKILIESDVQNQIYQLIDQANQAGITVNQYLESRQQTLDQYKKDLEKRILTEWTINLSIQKIAESNQIKVSETEAKEFIEKNPNLGQNQHLVYYFLTQKKVIDFLKK